MYKKYFLMDDDDIVESEIFDTPEFEVDESILGGNIIYDIVIYGQEMVPYRDMDPDGNEYQSWEEMQTQNLVGCVIMESDDYDELDLFRRLNGYRSK